MAVTDNVRRIRVPEKARKGEIITVRTMAEHRMESGVGLDPVTNIVKPRFIIHRVICRYNGREVFVAEWFSGVSANPFMAFKIRAEESGIIEVTWIDDYNRSTSASAELIVTDEAGAEMS